MIFRSTSELQNETNIVQFEPFKHQDILCMLQKKVFTDHLFCLLIEQNIIRIRNGRLYFYFLKRYQIS